MAMSSAILGPLLRSAVESVDFDDYYTGDVDEYADARDAYQDAVYEAMAEAIITHIQTSGVVAGLATAVTAGAATAPVTGTIT